LDYDEKPNYDGYRKMFRTLFDECVPPPHVALAWVTRRVTIRVSF
jgi:hypothetical protein